MTAATSIATLIRRAGATSFVVGRIRRALLSPTLSAAVRRRRHAARQADGLLSLLRSRRTASKNDLHA